MMQVRKNSRKHIQKKDPSSSPVMKKLFEHDKRFNEHDKLFAKIDKRFEQVDKRFERIEAKLEEHDQKFEFLIKKFMNHEERLMRIEETMVTKTEFFELCNKIDNSFDKINNSFVTKTEFLELYNKIDNFLVLYTKKDQENTILAHQLRRTEERIDGHDKDISQIKLAINLA